MNKVTVQGSNGRRYEIRTQTYGTRSVVQRLYYGGIYLASTDDLGPNGESNSTLETTIERANERAEQLGILVAEKGTIEYTG